MRSLFSFLFIFLSSFFAIDAIAQNTASTQATSIDYLDRSNEHTQAVQAFERPFNYVDGLVLGAIEGITEFLPISSTGHLIVANHALKLDQDIVIPDENGDTLFIKNDKGEISVYTYKAAIDAYIVIIQIGAIMVILLLYRNRFVAMFNGVFRKKDTEGQSFEVGRNLALNLIVAFLPAAFMGLLLHQWIMEHLFNIPTVITCLLIGAVIMIIAERRREKIALNEYKAEETPASDLKIEDLTMKQALTIGALQCIALIPGMSRSMITIVGGYYVGLTPLAAAEFSFLLGFVTLAAASCYEILKDGSTMLEVFDFGPLLFGLVIAFISGIFVIRWFISYIPKNGIKLFAYYRIGLALVIGLLLILK